MRAAITSALLLATGLGMAQSPLVGFEYWFDQDHINRIYIDTIAPGMVLNETHSPPLAGLPPGVHHIHYRLRDEQGRWSSVLHRTFTKYHPAPHHIVQLRYWSQQVQTGPADMVEVPIAPPVQYLNHIDSLLFCNWPDNDETTVFFQLKDNHGQWSSVLTRTLDIDHVTAAPGTPSITGDDNVQAGTEHTYTATSTDAAHYVWDLPPGWTGTSTTNSITTTVGDEGGDFTITVVAVNGCGESDPATLDVHVSGVGIGEVGKSGFSIAPNPTQERVRITFAEGTHPEQLAVLDATGRLVFSQPIANTTGPVTVDLSGHESGVYFVQVRFADGTRAVERVVKE